MSEPETPPPVEKSHSYLQKLWVPITVLIGFILGEVISYYSTGPSEVCIGGPDEVGPCGPFPRFPRFENDPSIQFHIILTTISITLLVALVVVYVKMFMETKANFSLGLVVVLFALLLQALLSYPIVIGFIGQVSLGPGLSSEFADVFTVAAYIVFLYLSLE